jgi:putative transposase
MMSTLYSRHSIRLREFDYSTPGAYFVTTCTYHRKPIFSAARLRNEVEDALGWLPGRFSNVELDEFIIMPDHVHFLIWLTKDERRRGGHPAAQGGQTPAPTLPNIVGAFKTIAARAINARRRTTGQPVWQRNYYEHIVRDEAELARIREYIRNNPLGSHSHEEGDLALAWEQL